MCVSDCLCVCLCMSMHLCMLETLSVHVSVYVCVCVLISPGRGSGDQCSLTSGAPGHQGGNQGIWPSDSSLSLGSLIRDSASPRVPVQCQTRPARVFSVDSLCLFISLDSPTFVAKHHFPTLPLPNPLCGYETNLNDNT